ncbi:alpha/beta hydrolase, partial [Cribrihabitans sp. XS_ASV171]
PEGAPDTGSVEVQVTPEDIGAAIYRLQTSKYGAAALPATLAQLAAGGPEGLAQELGNEAVASIVGGLTEDGSELMLLMHAAMICTDDPAMDVPGATAENETYYARTFARSEAMQYVTLCSALDLPQLPDSSDALVKSDVPVLILSGGLDVQTPLYMAESLTPSLPNAEQV